jgi:uncharacterized protein YbjT (DUF2867 family)
VEKLLQTTDHTVIASYRREEKEGMMHERVQWRRVNLYDDLSTEEFLEGVDILVYLVHSLEAKEFENLDHIFADRSGKFAQKMGVKKIIYLGGIIPKNEELSAHLRSRQETGKVLASHGVPVAEVRASILLGVCSVSYQMVYWLSRRLPILIMPKWSRTKCSPIALEDAVDMIASLINREVKGHELFEIGSEIMGYDELVMRSGAITRRRKNRIIYVPVFPIPFAAYWVQMLTGVSRHVASALMGSLKNDSMVTHNRFMEVVGREPRKIDETLRDLHKKMGQ